MTGPEHYRDAERNIEYAKGAQQGSEQEHFHLALAQVHATLALAAQRADAPAVVVHVDGKIASGEQARAIAKQITTAIRTAGVTR